MTAVLTTDTQDVITLAQEFKTQATTQPDCKRCAGESPYHQPGCPEGLELRASIQGMGLRYDSDLLRA